MTTVCATDSGTRDRGTAKDDLRKVGLLIECGISPKNGECLPATASTWKQRAARNERVLDFLSFIVIHESENAR